jgi:8-oxo-dGTP diphosphatase
MAASSDFPDCFYRVSVKGLCVRDGKILILKEAEHLSGQWELPGGGLDFGEDPREGLRREIEEETGLLVASISFDPVYVWTSRIENRRNMPWYYTLVLGYRIELGDLDFTPSEECLEIGFFSKEELQNLDLFDQSLPLRTRFDPEDFASA